VNYNKTTATLIRGGEELEQRIKDNLGCQIAYFPLNYLNLRLALRPLTKSEWQPALDMMIHTMPAWQRGLIDRAGRLILIKAVIMARPIHQLLIAEAPVWLLEEIVKWARAFFWAGKQEISGGQCLVAWDNICRPWSQGGLGIKNLQLQGLALRSRWEWLRRTDPERPWQGLPMLRDQSTRAVFDTLAVITIGDGKQVMFWIDRWINGLTATDIAPMVVVSVSTRKKNKRRVADAIVQDAWVGDVNINISIEGWLQCINLWEAIDSIRLDASRPDRFRWTGSPSGEYSAKSTYKMLCQGRTTVAFYKPIWRSFAPLKCKIFCWLALKHRLWTSDRRARWGYRKIRMFVSLVCRERTMWSIFWCNVHTPDRCGQDVFMQQDYT
jgi:hypothetical protein